MNHYLVFAIGFTAQLLFSARLLVQWFASERAGRILSPLVFWQLSVLASFLLVLYGVLRHDPAIILGQAVTYGIYIRNLHYYGFWGKIPAAVRILVVAMPVLAIAQLLAGETYSLARIVGNKDISTALMIWGIAGQVVFTFRFVLQWLYSEKRQQSVLPIQFWLVSIFGSLMVLTYAIVRRDPVLLLGQAFGFVVYFRNTLLWWRQRRALEQQ